MYGTIAFHYAFPLVTNGLEDRLSKNGYIIVPWLINPAHPPALACGRDAMNLRQGGTGRLAGSREMISVDVFGGSLMRRPPITRTKGSGDKLQFLPLAKKQELFALWTGVAGSG